MYIVSGSYIINDFLLCQMLYEEVYLSLVIFLHFCFEKFNYMACLVNFKSLVVLLSDIRREPAHVTFKTARARRFFF